MVAVEIDPVLAARAAGDDRRPYAPAQADRFEVVEADALRITELPGPPPTALVANLPYNVSVPVLLHLMALLPSLRHGLVMVQAEVADRLAAPAGLAHLRRAVGQGRLVRRRTPGRVVGRSRVLAGAQRRLRAGRLDAPRPAGRSTRPASRSSRSSTRPSPSAARRCAPRSRSWPARPRPPRRRSRTPGSTRWRAASRSASSSSRGSPRACEPHGEPARRRWRVTAPGKINLSLGVGPVRPDGFHPLATVYQAIGLYDRVTVTAPTT